MNTSSAPPSLGAATAQSAVDSAFASWAAPSCTSWSTVNRGPTTSVANASDGQNTVLWVSDTWPAALGDPSSTLGVTTSVWRSGGFFIDGDIQFNNVRFTWSTTGTGGTVDTQSIAAHEEGHFLGLGHSTRAAAVMYPTYSSGLKRTLDADDVNGVCAIYPYVGPMRDAGATLDVTDATDAGAMPDVFDATVMDARPPAYLGEDCSTQSCDVGLTCLCAPGGRCVCGSTCSGSMPCPTGYACAPTSGGSYCVRGGNTGDPCASSIDCNSGLCVNTGSSSICSQACTDDCTCPSDYSCSRTTSGQSICVPGVRACGLPDASRADTGEPDVADEPDVGADVTYVGEGENCASSPCTPGLQCLCEFTPYCVCAVECRSAPCTGPNTCQDTTLGPYCLPPGGGGAACSSGLDCITGVCLTTASGGACAPPCRDDCDCGMSQSCYPSANPGVNVCDVGFNQCGVVPDAGAMDVATMDAGTAADVPTTDTGPAMDVAMESGPATDASGPMMDAGGFDSAAPSDVAMPAVDASSDAMFADVAPTDAIDAATAEVANDSTGSDVLPGREDAPEASVPRDVAVADAAPDASDAGGDAGDAGVTTMRPGCGCRTPGGRGSRSGYPVLLLGAAAVIARRRSSRRRR